jgi:autophagy-related protein 101
MCTYYIAERQICREKLGEMLGEKVFNIADLMNRHDYIPKMPNQTELDLIFDTNFPDVQPYLFKVRYMILSHIGVFIYCKIK